MYLLALPCVFFIFFIFFFICAENRDHSGFEPFCLSRKTCHDYILFIYLFSLFFFVPLPYFAEHWMGIYALSLHFKLTNMNKWNINCTFIHSMCTQTPTHSILLFIRFKNSFDRVFFRFDYKSNEK